MRTIGLFLGLAMLAFSSCRQEQAACDFGATRTHTTPRPDPPPTVPSEVLAPLDRTRLQVPEGWRLHLDQKLGFALAHPEELRPDREQGLPLHLHELGSQALGIACFVGQGRHAFPAGVPLPGRHDLARLLHSAFGPAQAGALEYYGLAGDYAVPASLTTTLDGKPARQLDLVRRMPCAEGGAAECEELTIFARLVVVQAGGEIWQIWTHSFDEATAERREALLSTLLHSWRFFGPPAEAE